MTPIVEHPYQILYVDDEPDNLIAFKAVFRREYRLLICESGKEALEILEREDVDLIISDQRMPGMTGSELLEQVRLKYPDVVRMILTGYADMGSIIDAINKGKIYHYISKPWDVDDLRVILRNALEAYALKQKNQSLESEKAQLELKLALQQKEQLENQYEVLKSQINPHFLFNSLNILSSLISTAPEKAIEFSNQFSSVYRRLLELRDKTLVSLKEELDFCNSYLYLQQMRFEPNLQVVMTIQEEDYLKKLPPFALQLLIENAIKHNIISMDMPLRITIQSNGSELLVQNNKQLRGNRPPSTGIGLANLTERYRLLSDRAVGLMQTEDKFEVRLPLLVQEENVLIQ